MDIRDWRKESRAVPGDRYDPASDITPEFLDRVFGWIQRTGEVLVVLRYLRGAGAIDFALCRTREDFEAVLHVVPVGTDIEVFRDPQLPLRGAVDEALVASALGSIREGQSYLLLSLKTEADNPISEFYEWDCDHSELAISLRKHSGEKVAIGPCPDFHVADHEGLTSASKGGINGPR